MKLLVAHPGADVSTYDVWLGYTDALRALGHEVTDYRLDQRINRAGPFLQHCYESAKAKGQDVPEPTPGDVLYWAGIWLLEMALRTQPDWVLVISGMYLVPDVVILLRRAGVRVAVLFTEGPYDHDRELEYARYADVVFTNERASVLGLKQVNPNVAYLPHAYDPKRHHPHPNGRDACTICPPLTESVASHDVVFIGSAFRERVALLEAVDWTDIDLGLYGQWEDLEDNSPLQPYICGGVVKNEIAAELYRNAKIGLNLYRQLEGWGAPGARRVGGAESLNPRAYELAACGTFTISDERAEIGEVFGGNVAVFRTAADLEFEIRRWLELDSRREVRAGALQGCVLGHTFTDRAAYLIDCLGRFQQAEREQAPQVLRSVS
jgi:spore maturation protein CgeB